MAEGLFIEKVNRAGLAGFFDVDSAGTGAWHIGNLPDERMRIKARENGVELTSRARQIIREDLQLFDYIIAMDKSNQNDILALSTGNEAKAKVVLMRNYDNATKNLNVPDPYLGGEREFQNVFDILDRSTANFLNELREEKNL